MKRLIFLFLITVSAAFSSDLSDQFKYYDGYGFSENSIQEAREQAYQSAVQSAVRENFGFIVESQTESYSSDLKVYSLNRANIQSKIVKVHGFELVTEKVEEVEGGIKVFSKYRYNIEEIKNEKKRQSIKKEIESSLNEYGEANQLTTKVLIKTQPEGALVKINGEIFGKTPILIHQHFKKGLSHITIEHDFTETHEEDFIANPGGFVSINRTLKFGRGILKVKCPRGGKLYIKDREIGRCNSAFSVVSGMRFFIGVDHKDYLKEIVGPISLKANESKSIDISLVPLKLNASEVKTEEIDVDYDLSFIQKPFAEIKFGFLPSPTSTIGLSGSSTDFNFGFSLAKNFGLSYTSVNPDIPRYGETEEFRFKSSRMDYLTYYFYNSSEYISHDSNRFFQIGISLGNQEIRYTTFGQIKKEKFDFKGLSVNWSWQNSENVHLSVSVGNRMYSGGTLLSPKVGFFANFGVGMYFGD